MTWWQTLLITAAPVLITGVITSVSLIIQSRNNNQLEAQRLRDREEERAHQATLAAQQKQHERNLADDARQAALASADQDRQRIMDERWHAERVAAHTAFLDAIDPAISTLQRRTFFIQFAMDEGDTEDEPVKTPKRPDVSDEVWARLEEGRRVLSRVAGDEASQSAEVLFHIVSHLRNSLNFAELVELTSLQVQTTLNEVREAREEYLHRMRKDIGTAR